MIFNIHIHKDSHRTEEEILDAFRENRDAGLLGELYSSYMSLVYGVCLKYLKNRDDSQDAVMHIFEKILVEVPRHEIHNFRSWLHVVTKNYCLMQLRSEKTRQENFNSWLKDPLIFMESAPDVHLIDEAGPDMEEKLRKCIEKLREDQKSCIELFYFNNRCYSDIATDLRIDEKKVKSNLQNAKRNLKICLEGK
ncbi:MAG TPA: sigma-70 family RNA polymerase sigma factor [Bacteroidales bacterium]|nr:sigma-70 family RNA polymerase sigma factor [Bacteroidales bacterium]